MKLVSILGVAAVQLLLCSCVGPFDSGTSSASTAATSATANPVPAISSLAPTAVTAGSPAFTLTVNGSLFVPSSTVDWNGSALPTTYISHSQLTALVPASSITSASGASVTVGNPAPGGGTSITATFDVNGANPVPAISTMAPENATAGSAAFTVTVDGNGFVSSSVVTWNGAALRTTYVSDSQLTASVPASDIASSGSASITVRSPAPGGGTSGASTFTINSANPMPTVSSLVPTSATAGGAAFTLTVSGSNFVSSSVVNWNGAALPTTYVNASQVYASVPASDIASSGHANVAVSSPAPGGGTSGASTFTVNTVNLVPGISSLAPTSETAGSTSFTLTVNGSNFVPTSAVHWNSVALPTTYVSDIRLTASVPALDIAGAGAASVTVSSPSPGGGTSGASTFTINSANPMPAVSSLAPVGATAGGPAFTLTVNGSNFVSTSVVKWNGTALPTTYIGASQVNASVPASDIANSGNSSVTVSNPTPGGGQSNTTTFNISAQTTAPPPPTPTGSLPLAPSITAVYAKTEGATLYVTTQEAASGNYVQYFTATSSPGGITAQSYGNSNRIDVAGLTGATNYTFTVTATNAIGTGPASAPSASTTAGSYADYWVANGNGENTEWGAYNTTGATWNATVPGVNPINGTTVVEFNYSSSYQFILPYFKHSLIDSNGNSRGVGNGGGRFDLSPFNYFTISIWPTVAGQKIGLGFYHAIVYNGALTMEGGSSEMRLEDSTQNWAVNGFSGGWNIIDLTTNGSNNVASNTSNALTMVSGTYPACNAGDYYELIQPDITIGQVLHIPNASYGPATMTPGQWNTYKVPLSAFNVAGSPVAGQQILKFAIQDQSGLSTNMYYATAIGFTKN